MEIEEVNLKDLKKYRKFFSDADLWKKLKKLGEKAGIKITYAALLLYYALKSEETSLQAKATIIGALGYLIFPFDFIPDFIPFLGFSDDLGALILVISQIREVISSDIKQIAKEKLEDWFPQFQDAEIIDVEDASKVEDYSHLNWKVHKP
ncbi:MAG: YkvA family protein [Bacteroidota bacterium]